MSSFMSTDIINDCPNINYYSLECNNEGWRRLEFPHLPLYLSMVSCSLSIVGSILTTLPYILWKDIRTGVRKIITFLAIADFFTAFGYMMGNINYLIFFRDSEHNYLEACKSFGTICEIQSYISSWSSSSSFLWTSILALYLYWTIVKGSMWTVNKYFPLYHVLSWGGPILVMFPLLVAGKLGYSLFASGTWCFIRGDLETKINVNYKMEPWTIAYILLGGKALEIFTYFWVILFYSGIFCTIKRKKRKEAVTTNGQAPSGGVSFLLGQVEKKLYFIPIAFIFVRLWGTVEFLFSIFVFTGENSLIEARSGCVPTNVYYVLYALKIFQCIGDGAQGWVNVILYIFWSPKIRQRLILNPLNLLCFAIATKLASSTHLPETLSPMSSATSTRRVIMNIQAEKSEENSDTRNTMMDTISKNNEQTPLIQSDKT